jgi:hypothetical protein
MADERTQALYDELKRRGVFQQDERTQALGHELRARGVIVDPTQGGLVKPKAPTAAALPQGIKFGANADMQRLHPSVQQAFANAMKEARALGIPATTTVTSAYRSTEKQAQLYANRANNPNPVAPPGRSKHEHGLALDIATSDEYRPYLTAVMEKNGFRWGGRFKKRDPVHYEYTGAPVPPQPMKKEPPAAAPQPSREEQLMAELKRRGVTPAAQPGGRVTLQEAAAMPAPGVDPRSVAAAFEPLRRGAVKAGHLLGAASAGRTAFENEMERQVTARHKAGKGPGVGTAQDWRDLAAALGTAGGAGLQAARKAAATGEQPSYDVISSRLGLRPENTNPTLYGLVRAGEQLVPFAEDPLNTVLPGVTRVGGKLLGKVKGPAVAGLEKIPGVGGQVAAARRGAQINEQIIQPSLRHKENLQAVVRDANNSLRNLRKARVASGLGDFPAGEHALYDLAADAAMSNTGRYPGTLTHSAADTQRLAAAAAAKGIPAAEVSRIGKGLAANAEETLANLQRVGRDPLKAGVTREDWLKSFFEMGPDGMPVGLEMARQARRSELLKTLRPLTSPNPGPGLAQVPNRFAEGSAVPLYGRLAGQYLPSGVVAKLKTIVEPVEKANQWHKIVRMGKSAYLAQPWTPVKNLIQNTGGVDVLMQKLGSSVAEAVPHSWSAGKELSHYWRTGELSPMLKEFSDVDPTFLQALNSVKVADGTAGRFVRIGGKAIPLPTKEQLVEGIAKQLPTSSEHVFMRANGAVDEFGKLTAFKTLRARGMSAAEAVPLINKHVISYGTLPHGLGEKLATLDRNGAWVFSNVPIQLAVQAAHTAVTRPDLLTRPGRFQRQMLNAFGMQKAYQEQVPEERKSPFVVPNPLSPGKFVDYGALSPFQAPYEMARGLGDLAKEAQGGGQPDLWAMAAAAAGRSILGPAAQLLMNKGNVVPEGAPTEDRNAAVRQFLKDTYLPLGKAGSALAAATEGRSIDRNPFAPPQTPAEIISGRLGVRTVPTGTRQEQRKAGAPAVRGRLDVTRDVFQQERNAAKANPAGNPYRAEAARLSKEKAQQEARAAFKYVKFNLLRDPKLLDASGRITGEGQDRLRRAAQRLTALAERARQKP